MENEREQAWRLAARLAQERREDRWNEVFNDRHGIEEQEYYRVEPRSLVGCSLNMQFSISRRITHTPFAD
jgi:hypothetical protein